MRRSALPFRSRAYHCDAAIPMPPLSRWAVAVALLIASAAASSPWATAGGGGVILPDGFRIPDDVARMDGPWENDVTPEDYVIDKLASFLQQARRDQERSRPQQPPEEEPYDEVLSYDEDVGSPQAATEGEGPGFTYRFPEAAPSSTFAVNPSDPRYYSVADGMRSVASIETRESSSASEGGTLEDEEMPELPPPGRFPEVKPIKVVISAGTELPPPAGHHPESLRQRPPSDDPLQEHHHSTTSEQVKREKPSKVPVAGKYDVYVTAVVAGCTAAAVVGVIAAGIFWFRLQRNAKAAADVEYPAYGVTGPNQEASAVAAAAAAASVTPPPGPTGGATSPLSAGDRRLAQSAQMYHYQHQKQQIIAMESRASNERHGSVSEADSEEENEEGDYTVYECPGLAPTGEMEVKNPLFHDDPTPATPSGGNREQRDAGGKQ